MESIGGKGDFGSDMAVILDEKIGRRCGLSGEKSNGNLKRLAPP